MYTRTPIWSFFVLGVAAIAITSFTTSVHALTTRPVSYRQPDGLILSTGNLCFTSHDGSTASVWRTAQSSSPGQEIRLYRERGARFGDIAYAQVDGIWWGYFFATKAGVVTIKRGRGKRARGAPRLGPWPRLS